MPLTWLATVNTHEPRHFTNKMITTWQPMTDEDWDWVNGKHSVPQIPTK
jgi:hypothetical protein